tara:strand:+ start:2755 stop:2997 length:243 start_codon:yes stop_codon:yes gene_type:complete
LYYLLKKEMKMKMEQKYFVIKKCDRETGKTGRIVAGLFEPITSFDQALEVIDRMRERLPGMFPPDLYLRVEELKSLEVEG